MLNNKIDWWLEHGLNVLFEGQHGVGKTALIKEAFEKHGLKWRYFNRAPKKVRNAVMELIQFKSINGQKFPNLKVIWAAINPDDEEETYDVEKLDPAQIDRFHVRVKVPYKPDKSYFVKKYGSETAVAALNWWNELPPDERNKVSPRRLDYALEVHREQGDMRDILSESTNVAKLSSQIANGPIIEKLVRLFDAKDSAGSKALLAVENNFEASLNYITSKPEYKDFFFPQFPREKIASLLAKGPFQKYIIDNLENVPMYAEVGQEVINAGQQLSVANKIKAAFAIIQRTNPNWKIGGTTPQIPVESPQVTIKNNMKDVHVAMNTASSGIYERYAAFDKVVNMLNDNTLYGALDEGDCVGMLQAVDSYKAKSHNQTVAKNELKITQCVQKIAGKLKDLGKVATTSDFTNYLTKHTLSELVGVKVNV